MDQLRNFGEKFEGFALCAGGQTLHRHLQAVAHHLHAALGLGSQSVGLGSPGLLKSAGVKRGGAVQRQAQRKFTFFGDTLLAADQPRRLELDVQRAGAGRHQRHLEVGRDGQWHGQQHRALVTVVGQRANRDLAWQRPRNVASLHARRQRPGQRGGQARIPRVFPVGVPFRLVRQLQADPDRGPGRHPVRRMRHQLGPDMWRGHHLFGAARSHGRPTRKACHYQQQQGTHTGEGRVKSHGRMGAQRWGEVPHSGKHA